MGGFLTALEGIGKNIGKRALSNLEGTDPNDPTKKRQDQKRGGNLQANPPSASWGSEDMPTFTPDARRKRSNGKSRG